MAGCCCSRSPILSDEESGLLQAAAAGAVVVAGEARDCARALRRLGYLVRLDDGRYAITDYGRRRLAEQLAGQGAGAASRANS